MDNRIIKGDQNIAACFNDYFATIGSKLAENITENGADPLGFASLIKNDFCFKNINVSELSDTLAQIKTKKSLGIDGISIKLLKAAGDIILDSLGTIFNLSLCANLQGICNLQLSIRNLTINNFSNQASF